MKAAGSHLAVSAALLLSANARAQDATAAVADTPYTSIVARNMFGLLPIPVHNPEDDKPPAELPPKITPNGIMNLFGKYQALFKVANKPKPGQPAKEDTYVLAEGEMQDDITVVKINHEDGIITFNNHGTTQELPLVAAKESGGPAPGPGGPGFPRPGFPQPGMIPRPGMGAFQGRNPSGFANPGYGNNPGTPTNPGGPVSGGAAPAGLTFNGGTPVNERGIYQPVADQETTPEQSVLLIEAQRMKYLQDGNNRMADVLPPTPLTEQNVRENRQQQ